LSARPVSSAVSSPNILSKNPTFSSTSSSEILTKTKTSALKSKKAGGKVLLADVANPGTLKNTTKGIHTVVSALIGDDNTVLEGQKALLKDGIDNGIKRFVPSDFSLDYTKVGADEHPWLAQRIAFKKLLAGSPVKGLHVFNGIFMETFFYLQSQNLMYLANPNQPINITTYEDTARYVAAALAKPDRVGELRVSGDIVTPKQIADVYNKVRGTKIEARKNGSLEELKRMISEYKAKNEYFKAALLGYSVPMSDGRGFYSKTNNAEFPEIRTTPFEEYLKTHLEAKLSSVC